MSLSSNHRCHRRMDVGIHNHRYTRPAAEGLVGHRRDFILMVGDVGTRRRARVGTHDDPTVKWNGHELRARRVLGVCLRRYDAAAENYRLVVLCVEPLCKKQVIGVRCYLFCAVACWFAHTPMWEGDNLCWLYSDTSFCFRHYRYVLTMGLSMLIGRWYRRLSDGSPAEYHR